MNPTAEINMPKLDADTARMISEKLALVLTAKLLDHRLPFTVAAGAACRALDLLRNAATGMIDAQAAMAISLVAEANWAQVYASLSEAETACAEQRVPHFIISVEALFAELVRCATGNTLDAKLLN